MARLRDDVCLVLAICICGVATAQEQSARYTFDTLAEAVNQDSSGISRDLARIADPQKIWDGIRRGGDGRRLVELTAHRSELARDAVIDVLSTQKQGKISQKAFESIQASLTHLGDRYSRFDRSDKILDFLAEYVANVNHVAYHVPEYQEDIRFALATAALYGLANAGQVERIQAIAKQIPAPQEQLNSSVRTALMTARAVAKTRDSAARSKTRGVRRFLPYLDRL